jgi:hypothetical protein
MKQIYTVRKYAKSNVFTDIVIEKYLRTNFTFYLGCETPFKYGADIISELHIICISQCVKLLASWNMKL